MGISSGVIIVVCCIVVTLAFVFLNISLIIVLIVLLLALKYIKTKRKKRPLYDPAVELATKKLLEDTEEKPRNTVDTASLNRISWRETRRFEKEDLERINELGDLGIEKIPCRPISDPGPHSKKENKNRIGKAIFDFDAEVEGELTLSIGDIVEITEFANDGWWSGIVKEKEGIFPSNYVKIVT